MKEVGLYIHIPFCPYRCHYCDFLLFTNQHNQIPSYVTTLLRDLQTWARSYHSQYKIQSVYFGGGTPSLLSAAQVNEILSTLAKYFSVSPGAEISLEANPGTVHLEKLTGYRKAGVNRISLGVQAPRDSHLSLLGRLHTLQDAEDAFQLCREAGFNNINVDLLLGFPHQTLKDWTEALEKIFFWNSEHLSAYLLQVEEKTEFGKRFRQGKLPLPTDDMQAKMYEILLARTSQSGYQQYEISNFAKPGFQSRHNRIYWNNEEYLGIGLGAVSYLQGKRFRMTKNLSRYLSGEERIADSETLCKEKAMGETMMLGLRLIQGVSSSAFRKRFGENLETIYRRPIEKYRELGLLRWDGEQLQLTSRGLLLANEVLQAFL